MIPAAYFAPGGLPWDPLPKWLPDKRSPDEWRHPDDKISKRERRVAMEVLKALVELQVLDDQGRLIVRDHHIDRMLAQYTDLCPRDVQTGLKALHHKFKVIERDRKYGRRTIVMLIRVAGTRPTKQDRPRPPKPAELPKAKEPKPIPNVGRVASWTPEQLAQAAARSVPAAATEPPAARVPFEELDPRVQEMLQGIRRRAKDQEAKDTRRLPRQDE
jgi:hypothetical protein